MPQRAPHTLIGALATGAVVPIAGSVAERIHTSGARRVRVRGKFQRAGNLELIPLRPDLTPCETGQIAAAPAADTEVQADIELAGEAYLEVRYTNADGVNTSAVRYVDVYEAEA